MTIAARVTAVRARARVQRWEYRQRNLAHGSWGSVSRGARSRPSGHVIDDMTAAALIDEGYEVDDRGRGLEPPRALLWITAERAERLGNARPIAVRLSAELLAARTLALVPFDADAAPST